MKTVIENLIKNKEDLIKEYIEFRSETSDYSRRILCTGIITELKGSIIDLKGILQIIEFEEYYK